MGLDTVELVMIVEEVFVITIPDRDAERIQTVGDPERYVIGRVEAEGSSPCLSSATFYNLRRGLMDVIGIGRGQIRLSANLEDLIPKESRREDWSRLGSALGLSLPRLHPPLWMIKVSALVSLGLTTVVVILALPGDHHGNGVQALAVFGLVLLNWLFFFYNPYAVFVPKHSRSVRGLVRTLMRNNYGRLLPRERQWSRPEVRETLHAIICKQLGVEPDALTDDARFVDDLGAD